MTFLVVEKEPLTASTFRRAFEAEGFACLTVPDVASATQVIENQQIDGIVLDLSASQTEDVEWLEEISAAQPQLGRRTVVATAADLAMDDRRHIAKIGAVLLMKPFSFTTLRSVLIDQVEHEARPGQPRRFKKLWRR